MRILMLCNRRRTLLVEKIELEVFHLVTKAAIGGRVA
jgi:hypothetical protein